MNTCLVTKLNVSVVFDTINYLNGLHIDNNYINKNIEMIPREIIYKTNVWGNGSSATHISLPMMIYNTNRKYKSVDFLSNAEIVTTFAFLKTYNIGSGVVADFCDNTSLIFDTNDQKYEIPNDCQYLIVMAKRSVDKGCQDCLPQYINFNYETNDMVVYFPYLTNKMSEEIKKYNIIDNVVVTNENVVNNRVYVYYKIDENDSFYVKGFMSQENRPIQFFEFNEIPVNGSIPTKRLGIIDNNNEIIKIELTENTYMGVFYHNIYNYFYFVR